MSLSILVVGRTANVPPESANGHVLRFVESARGTNGILSLAGYNVVFQHLNNSEAQEAIESWFDQSCGDKVIGFSAGKVTEEWYGRPFPCIGGFPLFSKLPWAAVPSEFSGTAAELVEILVPGVQRRLLTIDQDRAWAKWFRYLFHVNLGIRHDERRVAQARSHDVLLIHPQHGCAGDRATLAQLPTDQRPLVILVTGGDTEELPAEWREFVRDHGAHVVGYVTHFRESNDANAIRDSVDQVRQFMQRARGGMNAGIQYGEKSWIKLACGDVHGLKNAIELRTGDWAILLEFLNDQHPRGGLRASWFVQRTREIQSRWQVALESGEIEASEPNRRAKALFDEKADAFVSLVQGFRSGDADPCDLSKAAIQMYEATESAFWGRLAVSDVHDDIKGAIVARVELGRDTLLELLDRQHPQGGSTGDWFVQRTKEIQSRWQVALESGEIKANETNCGAKALFDEKANAFVSLVQHFRSGVADPCNLSKAALEMNEAILAVLLA